MALNLVPLVLDLYDGGLNLIQSGSATLIPSSQLNDAVDQFAVVLSPVTASFHPDASPLVQVVPTDNPNILPENWAWQITFSDVIGAPEPYYFTIAGSGTFFSFTATGSTFTAAGSSFSNGTGVVLTGSSLPGGFWPGTIYYVVGAAGAAFSLAASPGGSAIASTSTGSGEVTVVQYLSSLVSTLDVATVIPLSVAAGGTGSTSQNWQGLLTPVTVTQSSGSYAATAGALVKASISGGSWTVNLPNAPANNTIVGAKVMANAVGNANALTIACQGSDVFEQSGGSTSVTMSLPLQAAQWQYNGGYWARLNDDLPLGQLDTRYLPVFNVLNYGALGNGSNDDTSAWHAARTAAINAGGGTVLFPGGCHFMLNDLDFSPAAQPKVPLRVIADNTICEHNNPSGGVFLNVSGNLGVQTLEYCYFRGVIRAKQSATNPTTDLAYMTMAFCNEVDIIAQDPGLYASSSGSALHVYAVPNQGVYYNSISLRCTPIAGNTYSYNGNVLTLDTGNTSTTASSYLQSNTFPVLLAQHAKGVGFNDLGIGMGNVFHYADIEYNAGYGLSISQYSYGFRFLSCYVEGNNSSGSQWSIPTSSTNGASCVFVGNLSTVPQQAEVSFWGHYQDASYLESGGYDQTFFAPVLQAGAQTNRWHYPEVYGAVNEALMGMRVPGDADDRVLYQLDSSGQPSLNMGIGNAAPDVVLERIAAGRWGPGSSVVWQAWGGEAFRINALTSSSLPYTIQKYDRAITVDVSGGSGTVNLNSGQGIPGETHTITKIDSSSNVLTIGIISGAYTINGNSTYALSAQWQSATVVLDAAYNWMVTDSTVQSWQGLLTPVSVSSGPYNATPGQLVKASISGSSWTVNLPNAPAANSIVGAKVMANATGNTNTLTIACQGSDVFEQSGGGASTTLALLDQAGIWQYNSGYWTRLSDDLPLGQLDKRYLQFAPYPSGDTSGATDAALLQASINAAPAGSDIYFNTTAPYYINAALTVTKALQFHGGATIYQMTSGTTAIAVTSGGFVCDGLTLVGPVSGGTTYGALSSGITVYGPNSGSVNTFTMLNYVRIRNCTIYNWGAYGIQCWYVNDVVVHNNDIYNINYGGISFLTCNNGSATGNRINSIVGSTSNSGNCYGISCSEWVWGTGVANIDPVCENMVISNNHISNVPWTGIDNHSIHNGVFSGNVIKACYFAIAILNGHDSGGTGYLAPKKVSVTGNVVDIDSLGIGNGAYGIIVQGTVTGGDYAEEISVVSNEVYGYGIGSASLPAGGIQLTGTRGAVVTGNIVRNSATNGISVYENNIDFLVSDNTIEDTWRVAASGVATFGVLVVGNSNGLVRHNNIIDPGVVQVQVPVAAASIGQNVSSITTLSLTTPVYANGIGQNATACLTTSGQVTVPTTGSGGSATLAYTGVTASTLTGVTLVSGTGTIVAYPNATLDGLATQAGSTINAFAQQTPATVGADYDCYGDSSTNNIVFWPGISDAAVSSYAESTLGQIHIMGVRGHTTTYSDASTVTIDASLSFHFRVALTSAVGSTRQLAVPANPTDGQKITVELIQPASGGPCALTYATGAGGFVFGAGLGTPVLTATASLRDFIGFIYNSTANLWYCISFANGY